MNPFVQDALSAFIPLVMLFASIAGPALVMKLLKKWNLSNEANEKEIEAAVKKSIHDAAANGLKTAMARAGVVLPVNMEGKVDQVLLADAIDYVATKNPGDIAKSGLSKVDIGDIVLSKVPELTAKLAATART